MDSSTFRYMLIIDWAMVENTPTNERRPKRLRQWHSRAHRLADIESRPGYMVIAELKLEGQRLADRQRRDQMTELARDMAVSQALGETLAPLWKRRLNRLVTLMGEPVETLQHKIERLAAKVQVTVMS